MLISIVNYMDLIFTSLFWKELFKLHGIELKFSTAYHLQTDGRIEIMNKCVERYLRYFAEDKPREWSRWISMAEWSYNTNLYAFTKITPFEAVYRYPPPPLLLHSPSTIDVQALEGTLRSWDQIL